MPYYQRPTTSASHFARRTPRHTARPRRTGRGAYIHPSRFVQAAQLVAANDYVPLHAFTDFNIQPLLQANIAAMGYTAPSAIQDQTIPAGLLGRDIVGLANTGTGKTAAFALPVLNRLMREPDSQALIMAPTRELAQQIDAQCRQLAKGSGLSGALLIGGVAMGPQLRDLRQRPRIVIGTPGRIKDHMERGSLDLARCIIIVLDEVDRMLDMGFIGDITTILGRTRPDRQSLYFSATMDPRVEGIINSFSHDPVRVSVKSGDTSANVEQDIVPFTSTADKLDRLDQVLRRPEAAKTLVFQDTQRSAERLSKELEARGFAAGSIHGGKSQAQRQRMLKQFTDNQLAVLVATDVAARGLDVADITLVVNYASPHSYEDYVHRIGRTGRAGKAGHALTFVDGSGA